ncbi:hypothetical protein [Clavibacter zhangzhiyongii]|uniref:hypothetical protein n=1 Tax=Clavibacter zhangzhiyongii TaxID=2768071 RepID=UPI0039DF7122
MRFVLAIATFVVAALMIGLGIAQHTFLAGPDRITAQTSSAGGASYAVIDGRTLNAHPGLQDTVVRGDGELFAAYAPSTDVDAWVGSSSYTRIGVDEAGALTTEVVEPEATAPTPAPSADPRRRGGLGHPGDRHVLRHGPARIRPLALRGDRPGRALAQHASARRRQRDPRHRRHRSGARRGDPVLALRGRVALGAPARHRRHRPAGGRPRALPPRAPPPAPQPRPAPQPPAARRPPHPAHRPGRAPRRPHRRHRRRAGPARPRPSQPRRAARPRGDRPRAERLHRPGRPGRPHGRRRRRHGDADALLLPRRRPRGGGRGSARGHRGPGRAHPVARLRGRDRGRPVARRRDQLAPRFDGPALQERTSDYQVRKAKPDIAPVPAIPAGDLQLTLPQATQTWPRTIAAVVKDPDADDAPTLSLTLVQASPRENYRVLYAMPVSTTAALPDVAPAAIGAARLAPDVKLLALQPDQLSAAYADVLNAGDSSQYAGLFDAADDGVRAQDAKRKVDFPASIGETGTVEFQATAGTAPTVAMSTVESGALVSVTVQLGIVAKPTAEGAKVNANPEVQAITGLTDSAKGFDTVRTAQMLMYVPP